MAPKKIKLIVLRHGRSNVRYARLNHKISEKEFRERKIESRLIHYASSTSKFVSKIQEECIRIGLQKHKITGYPRNDFLIEKSIDNKTKFKLFGDKKTVLYAPSWRHGRSVTSFFPFENIDMEALNEKLSSLNIKLLLRPHVAELIASKKLREKLTYYSSFSNIQTASHKQFPDVNDLIPYVDMLISDYSALYHDFLLLDRPIGFIPYDFDSFSEKNGFLYDYINLMPGKKIDTLKTLLLFLNK